MFTFSTYNQQIIITKSSSPVSSYTQQRADKQTSNQTTDMLVTIFRTPPEGKVKISFGEVMGRRQVQHGGLAAHG